MSPNRTRSRSCAIWERAEYMPPTEPPHWSHRFFTPLYRSIYEGPLFNPGETEADCEALAKVFASIPVPRVLDIGSGFGRHARRLRQRKIPVVALDRFPHLLEGIPKRGRRAIAGDMRALPFADRSFGGAYCLFNTFGYFESRENLAMLKEWARVLAPGAPLVLQAPNRPVMAQITREFPPMRMMTEDSSVTETYEYDSTNRQLIGRGVWQVGEEEQTWEFRLRLYTRGEIARALGRAGFAVVETFASTEGDPFEERHSPSVVFLAHRHQG